MVYRNHCIKLKIYLHMLMSVQSTAMWITLDKAPGWDGASKSRHNDINECLCFCGKPCVPGFFLLSSLCSIQRMKIRFLLKANGCFYGLIFSFSLPLFIFPLHSSHLFFQIYFLSLCAFYPFYPTYSLFCLFPCQHLIHPAPPWGAARTIKGFCGRAESQWGLLRVRSAPSGATAGLRE